MKLFKNQLSTRRGFTTFSSHERGFTLVELLIVIAIIGILASTLIISMNPAKRINQAKDSSIKSDITQISNAMQRYATSKGTAGAESYPAAVVDLVTAGELKSEPKVNGTISYNVRKNPGPCTTPGPTFCIDVAVYYALNDPAAAGNVMCWRSSTGVIAETTNAACTAP